MLPYFVLAGHTNYARWVPVYLTDMNQLEHSAPDVYNEFEKGNVTVDRSEKPFASVWTDMAAANCGRVIVCSPDTDVLVLGVHFCSQIGPNLWFKTGTKAKERYIQVNDLCRKLTPPVVNGIVAFHSITGSQTFHLPGKEKLLPPTNDAAHHHIL